jgi:hypothetical protein
MKIVILTLVLAIVWLVAPDFADALRRLPDSNSDFQI